MYLEGRSISVKDSVVTESKKKKISIQVDTENVYCFVYKDKL